MPGTFSVARSVVRHHAFDADAKLGKISDGRLKEGDDRGTRSSRFSPLAPSKSHIPRNPLFESHLLELSA